MKFGKSVAGTLLMTTAAAAVVVSALLLAVLVWYVTRRIGQALRLDQRSNNCGRTESTSGHPDRDRHTRPQHSSCNR